MRKITFFLALLLFSTSSYSNNAYYITLSNQKARKQDLEIITNNAANANTIGYEEDSAILSNLEVMQNSRKNNSFVFAKNMYKPGDLGALKQTNNPLDLAIVEKDMYFKIATDSGIRYTLNGSMIRNSLGLLVNSEGYTYLSANNDALQVPPEAVDIKVSSDGTIYADGEEVTRVGVAYIQDKNSLIKEAGTLYRSLTPEIPVDEYTIVSGALRTSNVNAARIMGQTIEAQRSFSTTSTLLNEIGELEKQSVSRILKP